MIIAGAGGFAKELYSELKRDIPDSEIYFFDDISVLEQTTLFDTNILRSFEEVSLKLVQKFVLGTGRPELRAELFSKFCSKNYLPFSFVSQKATIGQYEISIDEGCTIMAGCILTTNISIGKGSLINIDCTIGHDVIIGEFCELCPGVHISGNCTIEDHVFIGTGAVVLPGITIGKGAKIGAGAVVSKNVPPNVTAIGIPAKWID